MTTKKGIKMGVDAVMGNEGEIYDDTIVRTNKEYVSSINPAGDSDSDEDMIQQQIQHTRREKQPLDADTLKKVDDEGVDFDPMSQKHKQIQARNSEYQNRQFDRGYTPSRSDPFMDAMQKQHKLDATDSRSYRDIMQMQQIEKDKQEAIDVIVGKKKKFSDQKPDNDGENGDAAADNNGSETKKPASALGKRNYNATDMSKSQHNAHSAATPLPKR
eukprot:CAMPEP_0202689154 /NCGR_PEP_ID=MMETSP1385-20130828/4487_1 /ASSEMBLY_ACC=CAM_ASM_000861 /TAXON_ID=933848 /ORGANISM="Elphidium margaritaceum" /LENGTH=215 /DNA_ID=CAMNT_0049344251 /DNA_START=20 /DNA_END=663 /DNA_ORIENTATION=+